MKQTDKQAVMDRMSGPGMVTPAHGDDDITQLAPGGERTPGGGEGSRQCAVERLAEGQI